MSLKSQKVPHGMEAYDEAGPDNLGALSEDQQNKLNTFKVRTTGRCLLVIIIISSMGSIIITHIMIMSLTH